MDDKKQTWEEAATRWNYQADDSENLFTLLISATRELINRNVKPGKSLDIGCGPGLLCGHLHSEGFDVHGVDLAEAMLTAAKQRVAMPGDDTDGKFRLCQDGDIPFDDCDFDLVTVIQVLPYVEQFTPYIRKIHGLLKPGGILVASNTNRFSLFVMREVCNRLFRIPPHVRTLRNLIRTGYHSGGHVNYRRAQQAYSARALDKLMTSEGFEMVDEMNWHHIRCLDRNPLSRTGLSAMMARRLAWQHVGVYRKHRDA